MARVVIFGKRDYAELAHYYLSHDSSHEVVAFSVTADLCDAEIVFGLPLVPFEEVEERYPPGDHSFFVPMSGRSMNRLRKRFLGETKAKGYEVISYVSSKAIVCENDIGENSFIMEKVNLQPFVKVGADVVIWPDTHVGHHSSIGDHAWIGSRVVVSGRCTIGECAYLASGALVDAEVCVAEGTLAGLNATVLKDTEPWGIYTGNPARKRKVSSRDFEFL